MQQKQELTPAQKAELKKAVYVTLAIIIAYKCGKSVGVHSVKIPPAVVPKTAQLIDNIVYLTMSDDSLYTAKV